MVSTAYLFLSTLACAVSGYSYTDYLPKDVIPVRPRHQKVFIPAYKKVLVPATIPDFRPKVIGAPVLAANELPFLAHLYVYKEKEVSICTGSIIASRYVLTALHCLVDAAIKLNVTEAEAQRRTVVKIGSRDDPEIYYVAKKYTLPINRSNNTYDDIVLLKLDREIEFDFVTTAPVALSDDDLFVGESLVVAAHGARIVKGEDVVPLTNVIGNATVIITDWPNRKGFVTGDINRGIVAGDSGGPALKLEAEKYLQVGIVSKGSMKQVDDDIYGYGSYIKIAPFCDFIKDITNVICL